MRQVLQTFMITFFLLKYCSAYSQENHVFTGSEAVNYGTINLATPSGQLWSTNRSASPGYFSAVGTADYSGASDASNINGYVKHYANASNQSFIYPVGDGTDLRRLSIGGVIPSNGVYATAWIAGDPSGNLDPTSTGASGGAHNTFSFAAPLVSISPLGQWDWQDLSNNAAGIFVTVSLPANLPVSANPADLRLAGWNGTQWVDLSHGPSAISIAEGNTLTGTMTSGISALAIGSANSTILDLKLNYFNAIAAHCKTQITWKTGQESEGEKFELQQSTDGVNFVAFHSQQAKAVNGSSYQLTVPQTQTTYYRLKVIEVNAHNTYSDIIKITPDCTTKNWMTAYPNPWVSHQPVKLSYQTDYRGAASIVMYNAAGQQVFKKPVTVSTGIHINTIETSTLTDGIYTIQLLDRHNKRLGNSIKIVKQP